MAQVAQPPADDPQVTVTMSKTTAVLLLDLLRDWVQATDTSNEVPITAMRDWHRIREQALRG